MTNYTPEQIDELFDDMLDCHKGYSPEEIAAARVLHRKSREFATGQCLQIARDMLAAAKDAEMTPYFEQNVPKTHVSINPGSPTDFTLY